jgi:hypothetical protein
MKRNKHEFSAQPRPMTAEDLIDTLKRMRMVQSVDLQRLHIRMRDELNVLSSTRGVEVMFQEAKKAGLGTIIKRKAPMGPVFEWKDPFIKEQAVAKLETLLLGKHPEPRLRAVPSQKGGLSFKWGDGLGSLPLPSSLTKSDVESLVALLSVIIKTL